MDTLAAYLDTELRRHRFLAKCNYQAAYWFSTLAVVASVVAGLSVAANWFDRDTLAVLSALPGGILILFDRLKFEERSDWHSNRTYGLRCLLNQLKYEGRTEAEVSRDWREMVGASEREWPRFGAVAPKGK